MRTIDAHQHWIPRSQLERIESFMRSAESVRHRAWGARTSIMRGGEDVYNFDEDCISDTETRLADLDEAGVDGAVLQLGPWLEFLDLEGAREANDEMARVERESGGRLFGLAHVPPFDDGSLAEMERAVRDLGLHGVGITTHWRGTYLDEPAFRPFMRKVAELRVPLVVHATTDSGMVSILDGDGTHLGRTTDQTLIVVKMLKSDLLEELPNLRLVLPQLGGSFWAVKRRMRIEWPDSTLGSRAHLLQRIWFDTAPGLWSSDDLTLAVKNLGADRLLLGSDYPSNRYFVKSSADALREVSMSESEAAAVFSRNAVSLFGL